MENDTPFTDAVAVLKTRYGNHTEAAKVLGITPQHYRFVRGRGRPGTTLRRLVVELAAQAERRAHDPA